MRSDRVQHVIAKKLDDDYVETLCGRIVRHYGFFISKESHRGYGYVEWGDHVDCQDCLRRHYKLLKPNGKVRK